MTKTDPKHLNHKKSTRTKKKEWAYRWAYEWAYGSVFETAPNSTQNTLEKPYFEAKRPPIVPLECSKNDLNIVENR